jgi:site-specific DNA recombinase
MIVAAVYARKSTDDSDRSEEARSTTRQIERATEYARAKGWTVDPRYIFVDDAVSGAEWQRRPGLKRLLAAVDNCATPFGVLIISELSRIGRDSVRVPYIVQQIEEAGVEIHGYLNEQRISVDDELGEMQTMLHSLAASFERRRARQRTHDALRRRAEAGAVCGGRVFGFANHRNGDGYVYRVIEESEAAVVRRIFLLAGNGLGVKRIAATLNAEGAPAPMPRRAGRPRGWAPSSVREILHRDLYHGVAIWNQTARVVRQGARAQRVRPLGDVVSVTVPELAIVDQTLWNATQARLQAAAAVYREHTGGRAFGRPANGVESRYILTGLGACAACGGSMAVLKRSHGVRGHRRQVDFYGCMTRHLRGDAICSNALEVRLADADEAVLSAVSRDLLHPAVVETAIYKAMETAHQAARQADGAEAQGAEQLRAELAQIEVELARLAAAVASGGDLPTLVTAIQAREQRCSYLRATLAALDRQTGVRRNASDVAHALGVMREALTDWQGMLQQEPQEARRALLALVTGRLLFSPSKGFYTFAGSGTITPVIAGAVRASAKGVVAPGGFEPPFQP